MPSDITSWRLTDHERNRGYSALAHTAAAFLGPIGPLVAWGLDYVIDRRHLIFNQQGMPLRAFDTAGQALPLPALARPYAQGQGMLSISTQLTPVARQLGLRNGDPVSIVVAGRQPTQARSGLIVPARIGQQLSLAMPWDTYSLAAFASPRRALFTRPMPFQAASGSTITLAGRRNLPLPLASTCACPQCSPPPRCMCPQCTSPYPRGGAAR